MSSLAPLACLCSILSSTLASPPRDRDDAGLNRTRAVATHGGECVGHGRSLTTWGRATPARSGSQEVGQRRRTPAGYRTIMRGSGQWAANGCKASVPSGWPSVWISFLWPGGLLVATCGFGFPTRGALAVEKVSGIVPRPPALPRHDMCSFFASALVPRRRVATPSLSVLSAQQQRHWPRIPAVA